jgi:3'(2'), 5'-bisphosphate nucleotidase
MNAGPPPNPTLDALLDKVLAIALEAGQRILAVYNSEFAVTHKDDKSPLTDADLAAHHYILATLTQLKPAVPCLSEEAADIPFEQRSQWPRYWLVDPLDGTREFVKRNGEFTVNIALIDRHRPILGVVHAPALDQTYGAAEGLGAFRIKAGRRVPIKTRKPPVPPVYVVSRSHANPELAALLARAPAHTPVGRGSSLKFCLVAEGSADFYPRTGPTAEWDTAAGQCLVEQAGGAVWRLPDLAPLAYNEKESLLNPSFAVIGDRSQDWAKILHVGAAVGRDRPA